MGDGSDHPRGTSCRSWPTASTASPPRLPGSAGYVDGNAPLPEMGPKTKATWLAFQKKARTNYGGIACTSQGTGSGIAMCASAMTTSPRHP